MRGKTRTTLLVLTSWAWIPIGLFIALAVFVLLAAEEFAGRLIRRAKR